MQSVIDLGWKWWRRLVGRWWLDDPRPVAKQAPYTFFTPTEGELEALAPGDLAKLVFRGWPQSREWDAERMWVTITEVRRDGLGGVLDNIPSDMPQLRLGARIDFQHHHIIAVDIVDPARRPEGIDEPREYWDRCLVDDAVLEGTPVGYLYREEPDHADDNDKHPDSGWRIRADYRGLSDDEVDARKLSYVALGAVLNRDDSWLALIDSPIGSAYLRDFATGDYVPEGSD